jgi:hypothetical protein
MASAFPDLAEPREPRGREQGAAGGERTRVVVAHNLAVEAELCTLLTAFERAGVEHLVLKGIPLARRLGTFGTHPRIDNDLLVRKSSAHHAVDVARSLGYESFSDRRLDEDLRGNFEHPMSRSGPVIEHVLEVHWSIAPPQLVPDTGSLWEGTRRVSCGRYEAPVLDDTATVLHLAWHYVQHQGTELRILRELGRAWDSWHASMDPLDLARLARSFGLEHVLDFAFITARAAGLVRAPIPEVSSVRAHALSRVVSARTLARSTAAYDRTRMWLLLASLFEWRRSSRWFASRCIRGHARELFR